MAFLTSDHPTPPDPALTDSEESERRPDKEDLMRWGDEDPLWERLQQELALHAAMAEEPVALTCSCLIRSEILQ